jgi:glycerol-3-phosphate acyltransferase PlsX
MTRIAVDAMGGDFAPREVVLGAIDAAREGHDVVLVGDPDAIGDALDEAGHHLDVEPAHEVIGMTEDPAAALREKKGSSIHVASRLVASGEAVGLVSAGSTGAVMAAAAFIIGRLPGVQRPAIASVFPGKKVVLDVGANLACRPEHYVQFAIMGAALSATVLHVENPRVGLVNIGEERSKGREGEQAALAALEAQDRVTFVGNVEGRDIGSDRVDVLVTDGFTGNVLLKTAEGAARMALRIFLEAVGRPEYAAPVAELAAPLDAVKMRLNPETVGGAHLLGTKGVVVIGHGSSSRRAIANAITVADEGAKDGLVELIERGIGGL